jgi:hypothetical protein
LKKSFDVISSNQNEVLMSSSLTGSRGPTGGNLRSGAGKTGNVIPKGYNQGQLAQFTPEQSQLFQQLFAHVGQGSQLSRLAGGDQSQFEEMEAPAHRMFQEQLGGLASRFSQLAPGALSSQRSSGFKNVLGQASSNFSQDLASRRQGLQRQALQDLMGISESLLGQRPYEQLLAKKPPTFAQSLASGAGDFFGTLPGAVAKAYGASQGVPVS